MNCRAASASLATKITMPKVLATASVVRPARYHLSGPCEPFEVPADDGELFLGPVALVMKPGRDTQDINELLAFARRVGSKSQDGKAQPAHQQCQQRAFVKVLMAAQPAASYAERTHRISSASISLNLDRRTVYWHMPPGGSAFSRAEADKRLGVEPKLYLIFRCRPQRRELLLSTQADVGLLGRGLQRSKLADLGVQPLMQLA